MRCECHEYNWLNNLDSIENIDCSSRVNRGEMGIHTYYTTCTNHTNINCPCILCNQNKNSNIVKPVFNKTWYRYICCISNRK